MSGYYDTAQICLNGHVVNKRFKEYPAHNQDFCDKCGAETIHECSHCNTDIRGKYNVPGVTDLTGSYDMPSFCHNCGKPYPWTEKKVDAIREMADELEELTDDERAKLKASLDDIVAETPKTEVATLRFKKILGKLGKDSYEGMKAILVDIASETIKKSLFSK